MLVHRPQYYISYKKNYETILTRIWHSVYELRETKEKKKKKHKKTFLVSFIRYNYNRNFDIIATSCFNTNDKNNNNNVQFKTGVLRY